MPAEDTREGYACAVAHPNIALAKYWGKRPGGGNFPSVPSLSLTLEGMHTHTEVRFCHGLSQHRLWMQGHRVEGVERTRVAELLDRVRTAGEETRWAEVHTWNDFPTASGLASSASGFAALALAAVQAAGLSWSVEQISDLARRSSASAARSLYGGFVELPAGPVSPTPTDLLAARTVAPPDHLEVRMLVCVVTEEAKRVSSTTGMQATSLSSPYYPAWLEEAPRLCARLHQALLAKDFTQLGECMEASTLAMHAASMASGVVYLNGTSLLLLEAVRALRASGMEAYATADAGPHVKVLVPTPEGGHVRAVLQEVPGVLRVLETKPGLGARLQPFRAEPASEA